MQKIWTLSNVMSACRVLLAAPAVYCLMKEFPGHREWSAVFVLLAALTDFLDGYLARRFHEISDLGKIIDPIADKIVVGVFGICLLLTGDLPLWFIAAILLRDILIFIGGVYIKKKKGIVTQSNMAGKIAVSFIALVLLLSTLKYDSLESVRSGSIWLSVIFMAASFAIYTKRLFIGRNIAART